MSDSPAAALARLSAQGADGFDPVRFRYLQSMVRRADARRDSAAARLQAKAQAAVAAYQADWECAREQAAGRLEAARHAHPASAEALRERFDANDFKAVQRLAGRLAREPGRSRLAELTWALAGNEWAASEDGMRDGSDHEGPGGTLEETAAEAAAPELRSVQRFQAAWAKLGVDRLVDQALANAPDDPGPLNSQRLVVRSLVAMRAISPDYLMRMTGHIETLLWLGDLEAKAQTASKKAKNRQSPSR